MGNWVWILFGSAVTLAAAAVVVLWQAFKHLDLKIERLGERLGEKIDQKLDDQRKYFDQKLDKGFDQLRGDIAEVARLVAGHGERIRVQEVQVKAQEKQIDRLSEVVFAPSRFGPAGQHQQGEHAPEPGGAEPAAPGPVASGGAAVSGEGVASSVGGPEPTPPAAAVSA